MLSKEQLLRIKDFLEASQNPVFFFDNDADGLCSFLLLQRSIGRGKGVAIRSFPELNKSYLKKIDELQPDAVFILDKPKVEEDFINGLHEKNLPVIWIDHHEVNISEKIKEKINYFNTFPSSEPVTYVCSKIARKEDLWLAMIGCISDVYMPDFADDFTEKYPELFNSKISAFDSLFSTEVGKAAKMLNFGLKDTTTNVVNMMKFLMKADSIHDLLVENNFTKQLHLRYNQLKKMHDKLVEKAEAQINPVSKIVFFSYSGDTSMSSEVANTLYFRHKKKIIAVAYKKQDKANISLRGRNAKEITEKIISEIEGTTGGGHEEATGIQLPIDKLDEFREKLEELSKS
jgi:single-stranded DNA-specific DHH superfamily exonuclease